MTPLPFNTTMYYILCTMWAQIVQSASHKNSVSTCLICATARPGAFGIRVEHRGPTHGDAAGISIRSCRIDRSGWTAPSYCSHGASSHIDHRDIALHTATGEACPVCPTVGRITQFGCAPVNASD